jgi:hypothetical protein
LIPNYTKNCGKSTTGGWWGLGLFAHFVGLFGQNAEKHKKRGADANVKLCDGAVLKSENSKAVVKVNGAGF